MGSGLEDDMGIKDKIGVSLAPEKTLGEGQIFENENALHRRLNNRQIQLIAIGASIGTGLFISIGAGLHYGGPATLLLAFIVYSCFVAAVNNCMAEMVVTYPVAGGFIRLAGHFVDDAFGFMAGWDFFLYLAFLIPFEITALGLVVTFWTNQIPIWAVCLVAIVLYILINCLAVDAFGEAEFWLSGGKVILIFLLFFFTFITMVGGNPRGDAYGFRYWRHPGAFAEHIHAGALGRCKGFLAAMFNASFTIVGPEFLSMVSAEAQRPRIYMKNAYDTIYLRFVVFFIMSSLCCGIVIAYNESKLVAVLRGSSSGSGTAEGSPYVIAMENLGIEVLPHIINALLVTSIFSCGNAYVYCASRSLYALALDGRAPKFLRRTTKSGIPVFCLAVAMAFALLSFLQTDDSTADVLGILIGLVTSATFISYALMSVTYICFYRATQAQGLDRKTLPYCGWLQPFCGWFGACVYLVICGIYGYTSFLPWNIRAFFTAYTMPMLAPILYISWKYVKKTRLLRPQDVDLVWERPMIDAYEASMTTAPVGFWTEMVQLVRLKRKRDSDSEANFHQ